MTSTTDLVSLRALLILNPTASGKVGASPSGDADTKSCHLNDEWQELLEHVEYRGTRTDLEDMARKPSVHKLSRREVCYLFIARVHDRVGTQILHSSMP